MDEDTLYNVLIVSSVVGIILILILIITTKTEEPFTELYFVDYQNLPSEYSTSNYKFAFTIHNMENKYTNYDYKVYIEYYDDGDLKYTDLLADSSISLEDNTTATIPVAFEIEELHDTAKITVETNGEEIHFWMEQ